jgi:hypothetical protein
VKRAYANSASLLLLAMIASWLLAQNATKSAINDLYDLPHKPPVIPLALYIPPFVYLAPEPALTTIGTAEHNYALRAYETARDRYLQLHKTIADLQEQLQSVGHGQQWNVVRSRLDAPLQELRQVEPSVKLLQNRLDTVDACTAIYGQTKDLRVSDLTSKQTEFVKACQALDQYPPRTHS